MAPAEPGSGQSRPRAPPPPAPLAPRHPPGAVAASALHDRHAAKRALGNRPGDAAHREPVRFGRRVQPVDRGHPARQGELFQPEPRHLPGERLRARRRGAPGQARPVARRERDQFPGQCRPLSVRQPDPVVLAGKHGVGRGGVPPDDQPAVGPDAEGRTVLLRHRLPERAALPYLGLRRPGAALSASSSTTSTTTTACSCAGWRRPDQFLDSAARSFRGDAFPAARSGP